MLKQAQRILYIIFFFWTIFLSSQTVLLDEDFSSGSLPVGWSNTNNGGTVGQIWTFNDPGSRSITAGNISGNYAILDSDNYGSGGNNQNARLITPTFSTGIYETITLEFDYQYREYDGVESCVVEVYDGTTWTEVFRKEIGDENYVSTSSGANLESINITTEAGGSSNAQVRFVYIGAYDWWWAIDNVKVTGTLPSSSNAYLGPGGVGNTDGTSDLILWTNPDDITEADDDAFATWSDLSGYSSDLSQGTSSLQPKIKKNIVNGYDVVRFETTNRRLRKTSFTNFATNNISGFYVNKTSDSNDGVLSYASSSHNNDFLIFSSNSLRIYRSSNVNSGVDANNNVWNIVDFGWKSSGGTARISLNGNSGYSGTLSSGSSITTGGTLALAGEQDSVDGNYDAAQAHQGDFSEVILFKSYINQAERIIVNNYLSAKYNITLSANNFYDEDTSGGNFDHNVAGIGRASDGSLHLDSQGTGIIRINTPSDLNNDEFLFWGEDVKDADYDFSSSLSTDYLERLDTKWRVSKRNNLGTVSVSVKASDITLNSADGCNDLKLIVSNSSTFATKTTYDLVLSSGVYTATGVSFSDNDYFTIEYVDTIVLDGATAYNGMGTSNKPNTADDCYKLLVKTNTLTLSENGDVREVEIESGAILAVDSGFKLQVTNGINNSGDIRLVGTSQLVQTHAGTNLNSGSGNLYVDQKATTSSVYHSGYWSSPVSATVGAPFSINDVLKDGNVPTAAIATPGEAGNINFITGYDGNAASPIQISTRWLAKFNNASDWTRYVSPTATVFTPGEGWNMKSLGAPFTFKGIPNDGNYTFSISKDNYSLLGNPYPSALDVQKFIADNTGEFNGELYIYNSATDNAHVRGDYTGTYSTVVAGVGVGTGPFLPIGQAFFITRETDGTGTITFNNSQRNIINLGDTSGIVAKNEGGKRETKLPVLKIGFKFDLSDTEKRSRQVAVAFRGLTNNYDRGFDAEMWGLQPTDLYLKVADNDNPFIITGVETFNESLELPLVVQLDKERKVTFSLDEKTNIDSSFFLLDKLSNTYYNLKENPVTINLPMGKFIDRFYIVFKKSTLIVEENILSDSFKIGYQKEQKKLLIKNNSNSTLEKITLYSILGQEVETLKFDKNFEKEIVIDVSHLSSVVYIIKLVTNKGIITQKIKF